MVVVVMSLGEVGNKSETANYFFPFKILDTNIKCCNIEYLWHFDICFTYRKSIIWQYYV